MVFKQTAFLIYLLLPNFACGQTERVAFQTRTQLVEAVNSAMFSGNFVNDVYGPIKEWDVSKITNMDALFSEKSSFNEDIGGWDTSSVTSTWNMFNAASVFNQNIGDWNMASVTNMGLMFLRASSFDQDIGSWDVAKVNNMRSMFQESAFTQNLCAWGSVLYTQTPFVDNMFASTSCPVQTPTPNLSDNPVTPLCHDCSAPANACDGKPYCVKFNGVSGALGETGEDVTLTYDASKTIDIDNTHSYQTTIMKDDCQPFTETTPNPPAVTVVANSYDYFGTVTPSTMAVSLDIDTKTVEDQSELAFIDSSDPNKFTVTFCVKTDLIYTDPDVSDTPIAVASSKTVVTLTVDKEKGFDFTISAEQDATDTDSAVVSVNYPLKQCVCDGAVCLSTPPPLTPGSAFKFCIQATDGETPNPGSSTEVQVIGLTDVNFQNDAPGVFVTVPIVSSGAGGAAGTGVGPASVDCRSSDGMCVVDAVTYAKLYEADTNSDNVFEDISSSNKVVGTAILAFLTRRLDGSLDEELVEVGFGSSDIATTARDLQGNDATPVNEFDMDVNLASPPDRSSATSYAVAFVSLMIAGLVGLLEL